MKDEAAGRPAALVLHLSRGGVEAGQQALVRHQVDEAVDGHRRRHVGRALAVAPEHARVGDVARAARAHAPSRSCSGSPRSTTTMSPTTTGEGTALLSSPLTRHSSRAGGGVVGDDVLRPRRHQLVAAAGADEDRRGPAELDLARRAPDLLARDLVERDDERGLALVLVALQDHDVLVEDGRGAHAHAEGRDAARPPLPGQVAVEVVRVDALGAEVRVDALAVGHRRGRGEAAAPVARVVGRSFPGHALPEDLAGARVEGQDLQRLLVVGADAVGMGELRSRSRSASPAWRPARPRLRRRWSGTAGRPTRSATSGPVPGWASSRRRSCPPPHSSGHAGLARDALAVGPAPLRPVWIGGQRRRGHREQEESEDHPAVCTHGHPGKDYSGLRPRGRDGPLPPGSTSARIRPSSRASRTSSRAACRDGHARAGQGQHLVLHGAARVAGAVLRGELIVLVDQLPGELPDLVGRQAFQEPAAARRVPRRLEPLGVHLETGYLMRACIRSQGRVNSHDAFCERRPQRTPVRSSLIFASSPSL